MENEELHDRLTRALEQSLVLTDAAQSAEINRRAAERVQALIRVASGRRRVKARARLGWFCLFIVLVVIAIATYMLLDGRKTDSLVTFMLMLVPLAGGGWHLRKANLEEISWAQELERLGAADAER